MVPPTRWTGFSTEMGTRLAHLPSGADLTSPAKIRARRHVDQKPPPVPDDTRWGTAKNQDRVDGQERGSISWRLPPSLISPLTCSSRLIECSVADAPRGSSNRRAHQSRPHPGRARACAFGTQPIGDARLRPRRFSVVLGGDEGGDNALATRLRQSAE